MRKKEREGERSVFSPLLINVGIDIGGTFTDFVALDSNSNRFYTEKVLTTPDRPSDAVMEGLARLCDSIGIEVADISTILHATTLATNAVIERKGAVTGLLTTSGFEDVLDIRKGLRYNQYDLRIQVPKPFVPRYLRRGVPERMLASGAVRLKLQEADVLEAVSELVKEGVESLAVCFLHSYANPSHEESAKEIISRSFPGLHLSCSNEVTAQAREYERASTTVIDAYIKPIIENYLRDLGERLAKANFGGRLFLMTCSGGVVGADAAKKTPVRLLESGPVAGVSMAQKLSKGLGLRRVFSFDMGGTTAKGCVIREGSAEKSYEFEAARSDGFRRGSGFPVSIPVVRLIETGSGGGSIARLDPLGMVRVGPESAGSKPGPACYGLGGTKPTVTDADLVLGYLDQDYFLGGTMKIEPDLAARSIEKEIAGPAGLSLEDAAWAIHERVNEDVAAAFRLYAAEIGIDYRGFAFVPFGGAGPVHAARIARKLGSSKIVIPPRAGVFSAEGLLVSPLSVDIVRTKRIELSDLTLEDYSGSFSELISDCQKVLSQDSNTNTNSYPDSDPSDMEGQNHFEITRSVDMCYHGQGYDTTIPLKGSRASREEFLGLHGLFERKYKEKFGVGNLSKFVDVTAFKVTLTLKPRASKLLARSRGKVETPIVRGDHTKKAFDPDSRRHRNFQVVSRYGLGPGDSLDGPALIQEVESTVVLPSGSAATIDLRGNLVVELL